MSIGNSWATYSLMASYASVSKVFYAKLLIRDSQLKLAIRGLLTL